MESFDRLSLAASQRQARRLVIAGALTIVVTVMLVILLTIFAPNRPVDYEREIDHFFYGSIGSDISGGLPLKVLQVLPTMFPEYLPQGSTQHDYTAFGFVQEAGQPMPIGFSIRRQIIDLTAINCASCHTGSVREKPGSKPMIIPGMPANTVDLLAFFKFLFDCAGDKRFHHEAILAAMEEAGIAGPIDRILYRFIVPRLKAGLLERKHKIGFVLSPAYPPFGPGRVNTFDTFKVDQFAPYYSAHGQLLSPDEMYGTVDFTSIWNQAAREGLRLHWDGNNTSVRERNFSAAIGAGAKPPDMDINRMFRIEAWINTLPPPAYPFDIDETLARKGAGLYREKCFRCHDFKGRQMGEVVPLARIGTDRHRLDSYTQFLLEAQQAYTAGYFWAFTHFSKTDGYANQPLDGIWARAPYLHNGSVPSMWWLLTPAEQRPNVFTTGSNIYDPENMGFVYTALKGSAETGYTHLDGTPYTGTAFVLDTALRGNGNQGHTGPVYGTDLDDDQKRALIEYFKWQDRLGPNNAHALRR